MLSAFLSLIVVVAGYASAILSDDWSSAWCSVIILVLGWYIAWHNKKQKALEKELNEIKEKLDSLSNDKKDNE